MSIRNGFAEFQSAQNRKQLDVHAYYIQKQARTIEQQGYDIMEHTRRQVDQLLIDIEDTRAALNALTEQVEHIHGFLFPLVKPEGWCDPPKEIAEIKRRLDLLERPTTTQ